MAPGLAVRRRRDRRSRLLARAGGTRYCVLLNATDLYVDDCAIPEYRSPRETCHVYYTAEQMARFSRSDDQASADNEMQHCCIIRRS
jgi:hypothetical protein